MPTLTDYYIATRSSWVVHILSVSAATTNPVYIVNTVCYTTEMYEAVTI